MKDNNDNSKDRITTFSVMGKALKITFELVAIPIFLLFFGLFIDKKLNTTPLFIIIAFVAGIFFAILMAVYIKKHFTVK